MNGRLRLIFVTAMMLFLPALSWGQAKVYTKKMLLADFSNCTTKVVIDGKSFLEMTLRTEIASRWRLSPYEFCSVEDYNNQKTDNSFYFLRLVTEEGVAFLDLTKGGMPDNPDRLRRPVDVVRIPIAATGDLTGDEIVYMGAFIEILQKYVEDSIGSDRFGYAGLDAYNGRKLKGKTVYLGEEEARQRYQNSDQDALVGIVIAPVELTTKSKCYRMLVSTDMHELYYYSEQKYKGPADAVFSGKEIEAMSKKNAVIVR